MSIINIVRFVFLLLFYQDSNLDKQDQNLLCYHYTIEQSLAEIPLFPAAKIYTFLKTAKKQIIFLPDQKILLFGKQYMPPVVLSVQVIIRYAKAKQSKLRTIFAGRNTK